MKNKELTLGSTVWVVERDEDGVAQTVTGYVFLTNLLEWVIASPMLGESSDPNIILSNQAATTAEGLTPDLYVFLKKDCFAKRDDAKKIRKESERE